MSAEQQIKTKKYMTTEEILKQMQDAWMRNETAAAVFGFRAGDAWEDTYSKVSVLGLIMWVCAYVQALVLRKLDDWKAEVNATADATRYGTLPWWKQMVVEFQLGDSLEVIDGRMAYAEVDEAKRIVTAATIGTVGRVLSIKVAKGTDGQRQALTADERVALQSYVDAIKPVGLVANVYSGSANVVAVTGRVVYSGQRTKAVIEGEVEAAIGQALSDLKFGGTLYASAIVQAVLGVDGVEDFYVTGSTMDGLPWQGDVVPASGYVVAGSNVIEYVAV